MKVHIFQHVHFEWIGILEEWVRSNYHQLTATRFYESFQLPECEEKDLLIIMGGPMGAMDEAKYPWLKEEKRCVEQFIKAGKKVLGICLGSQIISDVLGARVYPAKKKEIGWFTVFNPESTRMPHPVFTINQSQTVFHWHGDTFDLPEGASHLYSSVVCPNQGFLWKKQVLGFQFHFEVTPHSMIQMIDHGEHEIIPSPTIQTRQQMLEQQHFMQASNEKILKIMDVFMKM